MAKKRSGVTKSGRTMNPADRERKQARLKELKKNKKQRNLVRQAMVKSRNPEELIEQLQHLDDQEFDPNCHLAPNVIADKRTKYRAAFMQMMALYRTEKNDKKVRQLETLLQDYEQDRFKKEQHYRAVMFSKSINPMDIPLPSGSMDPQAAMTPFIAPPIPPVFHPTMVKASILKKPSSGNEKSKPHKYPPGPPCGLPPDLSEIDDDYDERRQSFQSNRKVRFNEDYDKEDENYEEEDLEPVEIPDSMMLDQEEYPPIQPLFSMPPLMSAPPIPSNMIPSLPMQIMPGRMPIPPMQAPRPDFASVPYGIRGLPPRQPYKSHDEIPLSNIISAAPQVNKPKTDVAPTVAVITAEPQMRNMKKEATRFIPTALRVQREHVQPVVKPKLSSTFQNRGSGTSGINQTKSADEACEEFLKEIEGLL